MGWSSNGEMAILPPSGFPIVYKIQGQSPDLLWLPCRNAIPCDDVSQFPKRRYINRKIYIHTGSTWQQSFSPYLSCHNLISTGPIHSSRAPLIHNMRHQKTIQYNAMQYKMECCIIIVLYCMALTMQHYAVAGHKVELTHTIVLFQNHEQKNVLKNSQKVDGLSTRNVFREVKDNIFQHSGCIKTQKVWPQLRYGKVKTYVTYFHQKSTPR